MQLFEQKISDCRWTRASFLRQIFSKNGLFSKILAFLESAQWAGWKNGLTFLIWWTLSFDLFLARARQLKLVKYHSLTHLRLFSMLSDAKLWHFEVITPHQYYGYPWCKVDPKIHILHCDMVFLWIPNLWICQPISSTTRREVEE